MKREQSVPKRWHLNYRRRGTTQKKTYDVYVNLFTRNSPYYHLLKYLLFLLKHPVYTNICMWASQTN
jgi:hypothetical protein